MRTVFSLSTSNLSTSEVKEIGLFIKIWCIKHLPCFLRPTFLPIFFSLLLFQLWTLLDLFLSIHFHKIFQFFLPLRSLIKYVHRTVYLICQTISSEQFVVQPFEKMFLCFDYFTWSSILNLGYLPLFSILNVTYALVLTSIDFILIVLW